MVEKESKRGVAKVDENKPVTESTCEKVSGIIMEKINQLAQDLKEIKTAIIGDLQTRGLISRLDSVETKMRKYEIESENKKERSSSLLDRALLIVISLVLGWVAMKIGLK